MTFKNSSYLKIFFSLRRRKRLKGAGDVLRQFSFSDTELITAIVSRDYFKQTSLKETHLTDHINKLAEEFEGQPLIVLYHAVLIVLIRRGYKVNVVFEEFDNLWSEYADTLPALLNFRWLVSAADTYVDCHLDASVRAVMMNVSVLLNTVKLYETENWLKGGSGEYIDERLLELGGAKKVLFDGLESFTVGHDDTLVNMLSRLQRLLHVHPAATMLFSIVERLSSKGDSVYSRFRIRHVNERTKW